MQNTKQTVKFRQWDCEIVKHNYQNNDRTALELIDVNDGEMVAMATINLPVESLQENEVIIKDYSENEGMYETLKNAGIISEQKRTVHSGFISAPVCDLLI